MAPPLPVAGLEEDVDEEVLPPSPSVDVNHLMAACACPTPYMTRVATCTHPDAKDVGKQQVLLSA